MTENLTGIKATVVAALTALSAFLGWQGILALIWIACMALDYISGSIAAARKGEWNSKAARDGIFHKGGMMMVALVALLMDVGLGTACKNLDMGFRWPDIIMPMVLVWYIITEVGSILENAIKMGTVVPSWLTKLLKASLKAADSVSDMAVLDVQPAPEQHATDREGEEPPDTDMTD